MTYNPVPATVSTPKSQQPPENINKAITQCGLEIAQAVHKLGTAIADGRIDKIQAGLLIEEKLGLTAQHRHFFWRIHEAYAVAPNKIGTSLHPAYLQSLDIRVLDSFRPSFMAWCRDENRLCSNLAVKPDGIECKSHGEGTCYLSQMTAKQAVEFKYSSKAPESYRVPCRDPYPEDSVFHIPDTPDDGYDAFALLLNGVTATPPPGVPLIPYSQDDISMLFTDEELGL